MDFKESPLYEELQYVQAGREAIPRQTLTAKIKTADKTLDVIRVTQIDQHDDYIRKTFSVTSISCLFGLGDYAFDVFPYRDDLELVLYRTSANRTEIIVETYKAVLLEPLELQLIQDKYPGMTKASLNVANIHIANFQLLSLVSEELRLTTICGTYRQLTVKDALQLALTEAMSLVTTEDTHRPMGVDILEGSNEKVFEQIVIPAGTELMNLPGYLQNKQFGVYPTGLGHFYQRGVWYVYPLFDTTRVAVERPILDITLVPKTLYHGVERTSRTKGNTVYVISVGDRAINNTLELQQLEVGTGKRFTDPDRLLNLDLTDQDDNKALVNRAEVNSEFVDQSTPKGGLYNAPVSRRPITANRFKELSDIAGRKGKEIVLTWDYSDPEAIYPGQPVRIKYLDDDEIIRLNGIVLEAVHSTQLEGEGFSATSYHTSTALHLYVERDEET